jgi:predicted esterase YcpF (UPF0227 family)
MLTVSLDCLSTSCVSNVDSFSGLFVYVLLDTQDEDKQSRETVNIRYTRRRQTIQRNCQHWIHKTQDEDKQSRETDNIGYTRRRQTIQRNCQHSFSGLFVLCFVYPMLTVSLDCLSSSCVSNVDSFSGLFVFVLCFVYPMLTVSLDYLSSSCVTKTNNPEKLSTLDTQDEDKQSRETVNIGYTRRRQTIQRNCQH